MSPTRRERRRLVIVASGVSWSLPIRGTERRFTDALTRHADILWIDPPQSAITPGRDRGVSPFRPRLRRESANVIRLSAIGPPGCGRPGISLFTWPFVREQIRWALRLIRRRPAVFVACHQHDLLGHWGDDVIDVLYGTDDWASGAALLGQSRRHAELEERRALRRADLVLAIGGALVDRWRALGADAVYFPNGCDPQDYEQVPVTSPAPVPERFPTPVAGLIGQLSERIDISVLDAVADTGVGLLLIGPRQSRWAPGRVDALLARPNVHHVGEVPYEELGPWFSRIDVGLTPYADSGFNRASFPLKTLEYLAAGLPVVSTDLPASRTLADETGQVRVAPDRVSFARAVREAAAGRSAPAMIAARQSAARRYSWDARAAEFARLTGLSP